MKVATKLLFFLSLPTLMLQAENMPSKGARKSPTDGNDPGWRFFDPGWPAGPFARTPVKYQIQAPLANDGKTPASPLATVDVWTGGYDTRHLQPLVMAADGSRRAVKILWQRPDEPVRILFETGAPVDFKDTPKGVPGRYYFYFGVPKKTIKPEEWTRPYSFTLETKNFDEKTLQTFDHNRLESFVKLWNKTPDVAGHSLTPRVQHGYHQHRGYIENPLEYQAAMGAALSLNRYIGYFEVEKADETRIKPLEKEIKTLRTEIERLTLDLETHNRHVDHAIKALANAEKSGDQNAVSNSRTALTEWQQRRDLLEKQVLPSKERRLKYAIAAISEIRHNTHTFLAGSKGASWTLVDGSVVAAWPASEKLAMRGANYYGFKEGAVNLEPGTYRIEFLYAATGADYLALLLWRRPGREKAVIMEPSGFTDIVEARVVNAFLEGGAQPIAWKINADSRIPGTPDMVSTTFHIPGTSAADESEELIYRWSFGDGGYAQGNRVEHLYLQNGRYQVTVSAYREADADNPLWHVKQAVHIHPPFDLKHYIKTHDMQRMIVEKDLDAYPVEHVLNALRAVENLDPDRQAYKDWRRQGIRSLSARPEELAAKSTEWAVRAGDICLCPTVAHYSGALALYSAAAATLPENSPALRRIRIKQARSNLLAYGNGKEAVEILLATEPGGQLQEETRFSDVMPRQQQADDEGENLEWNIAWLEALMAVDEGAAANAFVSAWRDMLGEETSEQMVRRAALFRRIRSLIQSGNDTDLMIAMDMLNEMARESPERLISPEFNIMMLDMYLGCEAYAVAYHLSARLLNLELNTTHRAEIMARRVMALCGLREIDNARRALEELETDYPYSESFRKARKKLESTE